MNIANEYKEEYYLRDNTSLSQFELRFFSKIDRLVFAQKYDETSEFTKKEAEEICTKLKEQVESTKHWEKVY